MRAGIITFHRADNYGALLQAYALFEVLKRMGHDVEMIDYRTEAIEEHYKYRIIPQIRMNIIKWGYNFLKNFWLVPLKKRKSEKCEDFRKNFFFMSEPVVTDTERSRIEKTYDVIITGSDQIWNYEITGEDNWYCFHKYYPDSHIIAYAASVGDLELFGKQFGKYEKALKEYDAISVREENAREYLEEKLQRTVIKVLDPTLLLDTDSWNILVRTNRYCEGDYVLYYDVEKNFVSHKLAFDLAKKEKLRLVHFDEKYIFDKRLGIEAGPREFLGLIKNASYVVTSSFHATVFSIIFHKKFITVPHPRTGARISSILEELGLEDCICNKIEDFHGFKNDFEDAYERLNMLKEESIIYLRDSINNVK